MGSVPQLLFGMAWRPQECGPNFVSTPPFKKCRIVIIKFICFIKKTDDDDDNEEDDDW